MLLTGMRVGEVASLKNCYVGDGVIMVRHSETRYKIGENEYAYEVARNALAQNTYGTNPFSSDDFNRMLYQEKGAGLNFFGLA